MKKLNLGCGSDYREEYLNVDFDRKIRADIYADLSKKLPFKNGEMDYILLQDVLEHFTKEDAKKLIAECHRILKINGEIKIRVPDIYRIFKSFRKDAGVLFKFIYGNTSENGNLGLHKFAYSKETLKKLLKEMDFEPLYIKEETTNIIAMARKIEKTNRLKNIAISLLDSGGFGGAENFIYQLSDSMLKNVDKITLYICKDTVPSHIKNNKNIKLRGFPFRLDFIGNYKGLFKSILLSLPYAFISFYSLRKFKDIGGQALVLTGISDKIFMTIPAKIMGLGVVWVEFGPLAEVFNRNFYLPKVMYRLVKNFPDSVITSSENTKKSLLRDARISESKIEVIPCGIIIKK